ncbi:hypothetical protein [Geminocystis sp. GBBB08]|uniref:hypothetical protein n=1 Tax=Geminocystis sp. GBBB08 TaxID=2604140 RepID=UPI0027E336F1|nr:hypothetical protein [Geminocystis sp. GBBB08]MBL1209854.1 hypothetical protein [Geminocystis sp. GBBB08]
MKLKSKTSQYSSIFIGLTLLLSPLGIVYPNFQNQVLAQNNQVNAITQGSGTFNLRGRRNNLTAASVTLQGDRADVTLFLDNNQTRRFSGTYNQQNAQQFRINLRNSGNADAQGNLLFEYRNNQIIQLNGSGKLDGQNFNIIFRGEISNTGGNNNSGLNIQQNGEGLLNIQSRRAENITFVMVTVDNRKKARVSLGLKNGNIMNFEGRQAQRDAYSIRIQVTNSGMASATGFFNIELGSSNSINNIVGQGTIDGQTFLANFR